MLSKRDLLEATCARKKTDRTPVTFWRHFPVDDETAEGFVNFTVDWQNEYDFDLVKVMPTWVYTIAPWGGTGQYEGHADGVATPGPAAVTTIEQWEALKPVDVKTGRLAYELATLPKIGERLPGVPYVQTVFSTFMVASMLTNNSMTTDNNYIVWMRKYPEQFKKGLDALTETWVNYTKAVVKTGASGVFFAVNKATYSLMNEEEYKKWGVPSDKAILDAAKPGWFNMLHIHGENLMFKLLAEYPVHAVNWYDQDTWPSLAEGKKLFSGAVMGGVDHRRTLQFAQPSAVKEEVRRAIAQTGGAGYIVAPGCSFAVAVPSTNLHAAVAAAREPR